MTDEILMGELTSALSCQSGMKIHINYAEKLPGGDINETFKLNTDSGLLFLKMNDARSYPDMFEREFMGLEAIYATNTLAVPRPLATGRSGGKVFLVTEFIEKGGANPDFWENFAAGLSRMHRHTQAHFGLPQANYIGTIKQYNTPYTNWSVFYAFNRLQPLTRVAYDRQVIDKQMVTQMEGLWRQLPQIFPDEPPALLHGDLWSGNFMVGPDGRARVYDPAVYYGNREMDLAMARLFGGFDTRFYYTYQSMFPLAHEWQQRISICQLYPLMVHLLLFGGSYYNSVKEVLDTF
ncbi:fructosamine kinase family protein [Chitinophaga filiformis]|uniref:fructosamine kinase family protein n=1 Tax=Chitinophaga filiformis TaxID=104663 RepID=UPI001F1662C1|nr:fructosamine kinase family protein [Chitinophaga filiformis]MCF6407162.1 fructosamine kinase family protein [Chitinophaga filiformis]